MNYKSGLYFLSNYVLDVFKFFGIYNLDGCNNVIVELIFLFGIVVLEYCRGIDRVVIFCCYINRIGRY